MKPVLHFLKSTITGGILFLVPVILIITIISKAFDIAEKITAPLAGLIHSNRSSQLIATAFIVLFCFLSGLLAKTALAKRSMGFLESEVLSYIPGYEFMKGIGESILGIEEVQKGYEVVLARIENAWQIGFVIERTRNGHSAIFVPNAPRPWSGSLFFMTEDRIKPINIPHKSAFECLRRLGAGSGPLLGDLLSGTESPDSEQ